MARNDQARWSPLGSEDAPDRWRTKGRRTPFRGQERWVFEDPSSRVSIVYTVAKVYAAASSFVITGSGWKSRVSGEDEPSRLGLGWICIGRSESVLVP